MSRKKSVLVLVSLFVVISASVLIRIYASPTATSPIEERYAQVKKAAEKAEKEEKTQKLPIKLVGIFKKDKDVDDRFIMFRTNLLYWEALNVFRMQNDKGAPAIDFILINDKGDIAKWRMVKGDIVTLSQSEQKFLENCRFAWFVHPIELRPGKFLFNSPKKDGTVSESPNPLPFFVPVRKIDSL